MNRATITHNTFAATITRHAIVASCSASNPPSSVGGQYDGGQYGGGGYGRPAGYYYAGMGLSEGDDLPGIGAGLLPPDAPGDWAVALVNGEAGLLADGSALVLNLK